MTTKRRVKEHAADASVEAARRQLVHGLPVTQRRLDLAGASTAVLEGGDGPPLVLLHGPGESAVNWRWVIPELVSTHPTERTYTRFMRQCAFDLDVLRDGMGEH